VGNIRSDFFRKRSIMAASLFDIGHCPGKCPLQGRFIVTTLPDTSIHLSPRISAGSA
jgi:hypothetical protein